MSIQNSGQNPQLSIEPILQPIHAGALAKTELPVIAKSNGHEFMPITQGMTKPQLYNAVKTIQEHVTKWNSDIQSLEKKAATLEGRIGKAEAKGDSNKASRLSQRVFKIHKEIEELKTTKGKMENFVKANLSPDLTNEGFAGNLVYNIVNGSMSPKTKQQLLIAAHEINPNFFKDLTASTLENIQNGNTDKVENALNFIEEFLSVGFDLPAETKTKEAMRANIDSLHSAISGLNDWELRGQIEHIKLLANQKIKAPTPKELETSGQIVLKNLNGKPTNSQIDQALKFCEASKSSANPAIKQLREQVFQKMANLSFSYDLAKQSPQQLAKDVSIVFEQNFANIEGHELDRENFNKAPQLAPNVKALTDSFNYITDMLESRLTSMSSSEGAKFYKSLLTASNICLEQNNIAGYLALSSVLSQSTVKARGFQKSLNADQAKLLDKLGDMFVMRKEMKTRQTAALASGGYFVPAPNTFLGNIIVGREGNSVLEERLELIAKIKGEVKLAKDNLAKNIDPTMRFSPERGNHILRAQIAVHNHAKEVAKPS